MYNKRNLDIYPDLVRLDEEAAGKKESGEGHNCNTNKNCGSSLGKTDPKAKASNIAQKAAQEAKAANDAQMAAAEAAAAQVGFVFTLLSIIPLNRCKIGLVERQ